MKRNRYFDTRDLPHPKTSFKTDLQVNQISGELCKVIFRMKYPYANVNQQEKHRNFWSSTENYNNRKNAWNTNLNNGNTNNNSKDTAYSVRCVRRDKTLCPSQNLTSQINEKKY